MAFIEDQNGRPTLQKFLDLLPVKPQLKEEVQNLLYKLPELKLRPEKVTEDVKIVSRSYPFTNPVPSSMNHVNIGQLSKVDIDWKMLTLERPETAFETHIFSRIVYLSKITLRCMQREKNLRERMSSFRWQLKRETIPGKEEDISDEFTYEFFSRFFGNQDRSGQGMEETTKPAEQPPKKDLSSAVPATLEPKKEPASAQTELKKRKTRKKTKKPKRIKRKRPKGVKRLPAKKNVSSTKTLCAAGRKKRKIKPKLPKTSIQLLKKSEKSKKVS